MLTSNGNTSGPGSIVTPDGKSAGFLATYYGGNDPTSVVGDGAGHAGGALDPLQRRPAGPRARAPSRPVGSSPAVAIPAQFQNDNWSSILPRDLHAPA